MQKLRIYLLQGQETRYVRKNRAQKNVIKSISIKNKKISNGQYIFWNKKINIIYTICTQIYKISNNNSWQGEIVSYDTRTWYYKVVYTDNDEEDLLADEIQHCLKQPKQVRAPRLKQVKQQYLTVRNLTDGIVIEYKKYCSQGKMQTQYKYKYST